MNTPSIEWKKLKEAYRHWTECNHTDGGPSEMTMDGNCAEYIWQYEPLCGTDVCPECHFHRGSYNFDLSDYEARGHDEGNWDVCLRQWGSQDQVTGCPLSPEH